MHRLELEQIRDSAKRVQVEAGAQREFALQLQSEAAQMRQSAILQMISVVLHRASIVDREHKSSEA